MQGEVNEMNHEEQQLQKDEQYFAKQLSRFLAAKREAQNLFALWKVYWSIITSIYGCGYGSGRTRSTDHVWYINNVMGGSTLYVNKRKAKNFYQSARLQLPMEGKRFFDLFDSSIKTEEDLVKFKLQKEEEYKAAAAREAANEKDSSLQTQPAEQQSPPSSPIQNRINYFEKNFTVTLDEEPFFYACCNFHRYCV